MNDGVIIVAFGHISATQYVCESIAYITRRCNSMVFREFGTDDASFDYECRQSECVQVI